jgi:hypothetical protein
MTKTHGVIPSSGVLARRVVKKALTAMARAIDFKSGAAPAYSDAWALMSSTQWWAARAPTA